MEYQDSAQRTPWRGGRSVTLREIAHVYMMIGLMGFGGVGPITRQRIVVVHQWMDDDDFARLMGVCKVLPGPNTVNVAVLTGDRFGGARGAIVALAGLLLLPIIIAAGAATAYSGAIHNAGFAAAVQGATAAAAGLVIGTAAKMGWRMRLTGWAAFVAMAACGASAVFRFPLPWVLVTVGPVALACVWLGPKR